MAEDKISNPSLEELLELEKIARVEGSGINFESLLGLWKFNSVWKQGSNKEDSISSTMLQVFSASLELKRDSNKSDKDLFTIANSIQFGILSLTFSGIASLERKQPILPFSFDNIKIRLGSLTIFKKNLSKIDDKMKPFFALIALGSHGKWLAARGKGGGLALWVRS